MAAVVVMMISALVAVIRINVVEIVTATMTVTVAMESGIIATGNGNGNVSGTGIGMTRVLGPGYAYGGQRATVAIPPATVMTTTDVMNGGATIVGGRIAGASRSVPGMAIGNDEGDTSASV